MTDGKIYSYNWFQSKWNSFWSFFENLYGANIISETRMVFYMWKKLHIFRTDLVEMEIHNNSCSSLKMVTLCLGHSLDSKSFTDIIPLFIFQQKRLTQLMNCHFALAHKQYGHIVVVH